MGGRLQRGPRKYMWDDLYPDVSQLEHLRLGDQGSRKVSPGEMVHEANGLPLLPRRPPAKLALPPGWVVDDEYPDLLPPTHRPMLTQLDVRRVLDAWTTDVATTSKGTGQGQGRPLKELDAKSKMLMSQTLASVERIRFQLDYKITDHVLGLAVPHKISVDNIQVLATVLLDSWQDDYGALFGGRVAEVPVIFISELVAAPSKRARANTLHGSSSQEGVADELVQGIVAWATEIGRLVMISPTTPEMEEYYKILGFKRIYADALTMVYHPNQEEEKANRGRFIDFSLASYENPDVISTEGWSV